MKFKLGDKVYINNHYKKGVAKIIDIVNQDSSIFNNRYGVIFVDLNDKTGILYFNGDQIKPIKNPNELLKDLL